jgi:hypothetical protein
MNGRIKELADECTSYNDSDGWLFDKAKFAELIIRDCIAAVEPTEYHKAFPDDYIGSFEGLELLEAAVLKIKKRFEMV